MKERKEGKCDMTEEEIERQYTAQCQFSVINDCVDKNFIIRALITKKLRHNGIVVLWHSTSPQTWASELRYCANGLAQINPEILRLEEWAKFRKDFHLEPYKAQESVLYMHLLDDVTMFHSGRF